MEKNPVDQAWEIFLTILHFLQKSLNHAKLHVKIPQ
jgi:hypothetical protein